MTPDILFTHMAKRCHILYFGKTDFFSWTENEAKLQCIFDETAVVCRFANNLLDSLALSFPLNRRAQKSQQEQPVFFLFFFLRNSSLLTALCFLFFSNADQRCVGVMWKSGCSRRVGGACSSPSSPNRRLAFSSHYAV